MSLARTPPAPSAQHTLLHPSINNPPPPPRARGARTHRTTASALSAEARRVPSPAFLPPRHPFPSFPSTSTNNTANRDRSTSHSRFQSSLFNNNSNTSTSRDRAVQNDPFLNSNGKRYLSNPAIQPKGTVIDLTHTTGDSPTSSSQQQPLSLQQQQQQHLLPPPTKRPRTIKPISTPAALPTITSVKQSRTERDKKARREKAEQHEKLHAEGVNWRQKYKKALPSFVFYFDALDPVTEAGLRKALDRLGSSVDNFFSKKVTHVITSRNVTDPPEKENSNSPYPSASASASASASTSTSATNSLAGPIRSRKPVAGLSAVRGKSPNTSYSRIGGQDVIVEKGLALDPQDILIKANEFGLKIWKLEKAQRFLARITSQSPPPSTLKPSLSLPSLLRSEQLFGTRERDPFVPRADTHYFAPKSCYVLVEDTTGEHRPIVIKEYEKPKKDHDPAWPVLWGGIEGRSGFYHYDGPPIIYEQRVPAPSFPTNNTNLNSFTATAPIPTTFLLPPNGGNGNGNGKPNLPARLLSASNHPPNLRRAVSLNQLHRNVVPGQSVVQSHRAIVGGPKNGEYLAASGNSQIITSNIASGTSTRDIVGGAAAGGGGGMGHGFPNKRLDYLLRNEVATRGSGLRAPGVPGGTGGTGGLGMGMGMPKLKRSVSVDAGLSKKRSAMAGGGGGGGREREECKKPGYCENCRVRYDDFKEHVISRKHRRFAEKKSNWLELDNLLNRIDRPLAPHLLYDSSPPPPESEEAASSSFGGGEEEDSGFFEGGEGCEDEDEEDEEEEEEGEEEGDEEASETPSGDEGDDEEE